MYSANVGGYRPERTDIKVYTEDKLGNPHYSSRMYKILSHCYDLETWSVYVDADIFLTKEKELELIAETAKSGKPVGVFKHPWRDSPYQEVDEVFRLEKDSEESLKRAVSYLDYYNVERSGLAACGIIVRLKCPEVERANEFWWSLVCSTSRRDQITFPLAFRGLYHLFEGNIYDFKKKS